MKRIDWRTELGAIPHVVPQGLSDSSVPQGLLDTAVPQGFWEEYTLTNHALCNFDYLKWTIIRIKSLAQKWVIVVSARLLLHKLQS